MKNKIHNVWITVAYRTGIRVYNYENGHDKKAITLVHTQENPQGFLKDKELGTDQPGRSFDRVGGGRHSLSKGQSPSEHISDVFAKEICTLLENACKKNEFSKLILIAGPTFLGLLRQHLNTNTMAHVVHTLNKDLVNLNDHEMHQYLEKNIDGFLNGKKQR